ncbi:MAG: hypothetical protein ACI3VA_02600 [Candidatus Limivicinus sp.]
MKKGLTLLLLVLSLVLISGCGCEHEWVDATCTEPKTCSLCGNTEGKPLGHTWEEATCAEPKTCSLCGETEGEALGHKPGSWREEIDYVHAFKEKMRYCSVCGERVDVEFSDLEKMYHNGVFDFNAEEFSERLGNQLDYFTNNTLSTQYIFDEDYSALCGVYDGYSSFAGVTFYNSSVEHTSENFFSLTCSFLNKDINNMVRLVFGIVLTCDPSLSMEEAKELTSEIGEGTQVQKNGITYYLSISENVLIVGLL